MPCRSRQSLVAPWTSDGQYVWVRETTLTAIWCELFPGRPVTLGSPLPTYQVYILDEQLGPAKDGESGEIYIGGPGVAIGYLNVPDLTKECFIPNPVWKDREIVPRLYRTGDFGRITAAGEIEYLGRIDNQLNSQTLQSEITSSRVSFHGSTQDLLMKMDINLKLKQPG